MGAGVTLPKLQRRKNAKGRYIGSYFVAIDGLQFTLGTSDATEAEKRRLEAVQRGRRNFVDEIDEAAAAVDGGAPEGPGIAHALGGGSNPPTAAPPPAPVMPDAVIPPPPAPQVPLALPAMSPANDAAADAAATNEAAAESDGDAAAGGAGAGAQAIPDNVLDGFLEQGAGVIVDLQLEMQAALIRKRTKKQPARIPDDSPVRQMAAAAWVAQLKIWIPPDKMLPPWALAIILPAMCLPQQYASAVPVKPDAASSPQDAPSSEAAAA